MPNDISKRCNRCQTNYIGEMTVSGAFPSGEETCRQCMVIHPKVWVIHSDKLVGVGLPEKKHFPPQVRLEVSRALGRGERVFVSGGLDDEIHFWTSPYGMSWDRFFELFQTDWEWWPTISVG
jgi:hypothetical protein